MLSLQLYRRLIVIWNFLTRNFTCNSIVCTVREHFRTFLRHWAPMDREFPLITSNSNHHCPLKSMNEIGNTEVSAMMSLTSFYTFCIKRDWNAASRNSQWFSVMEILTALFMLVVGLVITFAQETGKKKMVDLLKLDWRTKLRIEDNGIAQITLLFGCNIGQLIGKSI